MKILPDWFDMRPPLFAAQRSQVGLIILAFFWARPRVRPDDPNARTLLYTPSNLSRRGITHKSCGGDIGAEFDVGETREAAPDDDDPGGRIAGARQRSAPARQLGEVEGQRAGATSAVSAMADQFKECDRILTQLNVDQESTDA